MANLAVTYSKGTRLCMNVDDELPIEVEPTFVLNINY